MSYYLQRRRGVSFSKVPSEWPAILKITATLRPEEVFQQSTVTYPRITFVESLECRLSTADGGLIASSPEFLKPISAIFQFANNATYTFSGNKVTSLCNVNSEEDAILTVDFFSIFTSQYISIAMGIFIDNIEISGTLDDSPIAVQHLPGEYSLMCLHLNSARRNDRMEILSRMPSPTSRSYGRFVLASLYYQHALRLMSPHEVKSVNNIILAETMLNLSKSLQILFSSSHGITRRKLLSLGYTTRQIESQIIPIDLMRNNADVAHIRESRIPETEIIIYRGYIQRSIINMRSIFLKVAERISYEEAFLDPINLSNERGSSSFVNKLASYLQDPALEALEGGAMFITG